MMNRKKVVIVDDSAAMRQLVGQKLRDDGRFVVVGQASDPFEAREIIKRTNPDVLTLDVEMPRMDGLTFLDKLMRLRPMPVVMLSTETHRGSAAAVEALSLGAVDCIGKPRADAPDSMAELAESVFMAASAHIQTRLAIVQGPPLDYRWNGNLVMIGASTGGVDALERILGQMPSNCPPVLVSQHMPETFLASFAERLDRRISPSVALARDGEPIGPGMVRIAPGGPHHLVVAERNADWRCRLQQGPKVCGHRPSVDVLFRSGCTLARRVVAVLLTGMGRDGADGMAELRALGAHTIAQDRESCVVYGMPRVAVELGAVCKSLDLDRIAGHVLQQTKRSSTQPCDGK